MRPPARRLPLLLPTLVLGLLVPTACADDEVDDLGDEPGVDGRLDEPNTSVGDDGYHELPDDVPDEAPATSASGGTTPEPGTAGTAANPGDPDTPGADAGGGGATGEGP